MPRLRITEPAIEKVKPPASGRLEMWDSLLPGFGVRIGGTRRTFFVMYRALDPATGERVQKRYRLGYYPVMKLADARAAARAVLEAVDHGEDPAKQKKALKEAPPQPKPEPDTFEGVVEDFRKRHVENKGKRTRVEYNRAIDMLKPRWGHRLVTDIRKRDVLEVLDEMTDAGKPVAANRTYAVVRKFFNWCLQRDVIEASPVAGLGTPNEEKPRQRVLNEDELRLAWATFEAMGYPFGTWLQISLLTGVRREEVATMRWRDLDFEDRLWRIPSAKGNRTHLVPLSPMAVEILLPRSNERPEGLPRFKGPYVFTTTGGERPISGFSVAKKRADHLMAEAIAMLSATGEQRPIADTATAKQNSDRVAVEAIVGQIKEAGIELEAIPHWTPHDLRRTVRTNLSRLKVPPHVAELVLGHAVGGIQAVYDVHDYLDERRDALDKWARHLEVLVRGGAKVVALPQAAAGQARPVGAVWPA